MFYVITVKSYILIIITLLILKIVIGLLNNNELLTNDQLLTKEVCKAKYQRSFNNILKKPALLYSFPGSGNTWLRLLIEYGTGIYSGSVYTDEELKSILPGKLF